MRERICQINVLSAKFSSLNTYRISFELYELGQLFWVSFHELLTIVC